MNKKIKTFLPFLFAQLFMTSCKEWIKFDITRYAFVFVLTLVVGIIGFIFVAINGRDKNN